MTLALLLFALLAVTPVVTRLGAGEGGTIAAAALTVVVVAVGLNTLA
jgi:hypothetical protein